MSCATLWAADNAVVLTAGAGVTMRSVDIGGGVQSSMVVLGSSAGAAIYGTAGTANANVITVQGIASGTTVPITGTLTAVTTVTTVSTVTGGGVASAAADSGNPLKIGGKYNASPITLTDGNRGDLQLDINGYVKVNVTNTNANGQATLALSSPVALAKNSGTGSTIAGAAVGTAGTAATEVVTIQGIASGTVVPVSLTSTTITGTVAATQSGTWTDTVTQATAANLNATVVGTGTFATQAALNAGTNDVGNVGGRANVTPTDCSIALTTGGTAQNIISAGASLRGFQIQDMDTGKTEGVWISLTTTAATNTVASYYIPPYSATSGAGSYVSPFGAGFNGNVSVIAATTGHKISCTKW